MKSSFLFSLVFVLFLVVSVFAQAQTGHTIQQISKVDISTSQGDNATGKDQLDDSTSYKPEHAEPIKQASGEAVSTQAGYGYGREDITVIWDCAADDEYAEQVNQVMNQIENAVKNNNAGDVEQLKNKLELMNQERNNNCRKIQTSSSEQVSATTCEEQLALQIQQIKMEMAKAQTEGNQQYYDDLSLKLQNLNENNPCVPTSTAVVWQCDDSDIMEEIYTLKNQLQTAQQKGDRDSENQIQERIEEQMKERERICNQVNAETTHISSPGDNGRQIAAYYKQRVDGVVSSSQDIDDQIESLKQVRIEIDNMIEQLMQKKQVIEAQELDGLVETFEVKPGEISADGISVKSNDKIVKVSTTSGEVMVTPGITNVEIADSAVSVKVNQNNVIIHENKVKVGNNEVKVLPSQAVSTASQNRNVRSVNAEIKEHNGAAVYHINTTQEKKFLFLFPADAEVETIIDAENGQVIEEKGPWWAWMAGD